jgi:hypothetical protein
MEPEFHYRVFKSPQIDDPVQCGALCVQFHFYTCKHEVVLMSTFGSCTLYCIHCTDPSY